MSHHRQVFANFLDALHQESVNYLLIRGFRYLPERPDTDIDLVPHLNHLESFHKVARRHLVLNEQEVPVKDYGFAEYAQMTYWPYFTPGNLDESIPGGRFRVDVYSCLFFLSPYDGFSSFWTVPKAFYESVFVRKKNERGFFIPSVEDEITLLLLRNLLDQHGHWKEKHKIRITELLEVASRQELIQQVAMALPFAEKLCQHLYVEDFDSLFNILMEKPS